MGAPPYPYLLSMASQIALLIVAASFLPACHAASNGMDMSMDGAMTMAEGQMLTYLHFTPGDNLWFLGWVPASTGAMVGTCIGLFLLGLVDRWIGGCRAVMEVHWDNRAQIALANRLNRVDLPVSSLPNEKSQTPSSSACCTPTPDVLMSPRIIPPFILAHDAMRGVLQAVQSALKFVLMLAVMTFQLGFIFAIVIGLGVGETLFGRYASHAVY